MLLTFWIMALSRRGSAKSTCHTTLASCGVGASALAAGAATGLVSDACIAPPSSMAQPLSVSMTVTNSKNRFKVGNMGFLLGTPVDQSANDNTRDNGALLATLVAARTNARAARQGGRGCGFRYNHFNGRNAQLPQPLGNFRAVAAAGQYRGIHASCRLECPPPECGLWVVALGVAGAPAKIRLARQHELLQAFGPAKHIERLQCFEKRFRTKFLGAVADAVMTCRQHRKIAVIVRHAKPLSELTNKRHTALFMADVLRPLGFRRRALAEV